MEMTMMIAVGAILLISMGRAAQSQIKNAIDNRNYMIALNLAKQQMAIMNLAAYPAVGTTAPASDAAFPDFVFSQVVTSVATSGGNSIRQIEMDVSANGKQLIALYAYRSNIVTFGNGS